MRESRLIAVLLLTTTALTADRVGAAEPGKGGAAAANAAAAASPTGPGCTLTMRAPEPRTWKGEWAPERARVGGKSPSRVESVHWASEKERAAVEKNDGAIAFEVVCASAPKDRPTIAIDIYPASTKATAVPLGAGTYPIVPKGAPAGTKASAFIVGELLVDRTIYAAKSGTLELERFDAAGAKGRFSVMAEPLLPGKPPIQLEGTFDMPCQRQPFFQSACAARP